MTHCLGPDLGSNPRRDRAARHRMSGADAAAAEPRRSHPASARAASHSSGSAAAAAAAARSRSPTTTRTALSDLRTFLRRSGPGMATCRSLASCFTVSSMFRSLISTYHSLCSSVLDLIRRSRASQCRPAAAVSVASPRGKNCGEPW